MGVAAEQQDHRSEHDEHNDQEDQPSQFGDLFNDPTIAQMLKLDPDRFEDFVQYVFQCAGYVAQSVSRQYYPHGPGVDLNLFADRIGGKLVFRIEVRRYDPAYKLTFDDVAAFLGKLELAGGTPGFMVTTSDFNGPATQAAKDSGGRVSLINGERLMRYITYVRGSRFRAADAVAGTVRKVAPLSPKCMLDADNLPRRDPMMTTVLAVANNRGGVAKTTTAIDVAFVLADHYKHRVLLVDMDSQGTLTAALPPASVSPGHMPPTEAGTLSQFMVGERTLANLVRPTRFERVWVIPADEELLRLDSGGAGRPDDELRFVRAIHDLQLVAPDGHPFDWIILDTPPAQSFYTRSAIAASDYVLLPANAEVFAVIGAGKALNTVRTMRALVGRGAAPLGLVVTRWQRNMEADKAIVGLSDLARIRNTRVFTTRIPQDYRVGRGHDRTAGGWVNHLLRFTDSPGPGARAYEALVKEMLPRVHRS